MSLFEEYKIIPESERPTELTDLIIRPAVIDDAKELGRITAEREGGDPDEHARRLERAITEWSKSSQGIILVAVYESELIGFGKIRYFTLPPDSHANIAPQGWYLSGVIVKPEYRRRGVGRQLTQARLNWIALRADCAYYLANAQNRVSIELHQKLGFTELTRDFIYPHVTFTGGVGILFVIKLARK